MKTFPECPVQIEQNETYFCRLLDSVRDGTEEEICSFCALLQDKIREFPELKYAVYYAAHAHRNQVRKGTKIPYMIHLVRTWYYVQQMTDDMEQWQAAFLHDTLEDTQVTLESLKRDFGDRVAELVVGESEEKRVEQPPAQTWELRKLETIQRMYDCVGDGDMIPSMHVAFGDKLANLFSMAFEYRRIGDTIWNKFNQKRKSMQGWYYGELGLIFQKIFEDDLHKLVQEYWGYFEEVFGKYEVSGD